MLWDWPLMLVAISHASGTPIFIFMTLDGVTSFSRIKYLRNTCRRLNYSERSQWEHVKGALGFSSFLVCYNRNSPANK